MDVGSGRSGNGEEWGGSRGWVQRVPLGRTDAEEGLEGVRGRSRRCRQCARVCRWLWLRRVWSCGRGAVHVEERSKSKSSIAAQPNTSQVPGEPEARAQQRVWAPDMKSNYLAKVSALLNSRIPSLQVSKSPSHRLENHDPGPPAPASAKPLHGTQIQSVPPIKYPSKCERH